MHTNFLKKEYHILGMIKRITFLSDSLDVQPYTKIIYIYIYMMYTYRHYFDDYIYKENPMAIEY